MSFTLSLLGDVALAHHRKLERRQALPIVRHAPACENAVAQAEISRRFLWRYLPKE
jgi:hypothetical protein